MEIRSAAHAVALLEEAAGEPYTLVGRLAGGETGAHEIRRDSGDERLVLKWATRPESWARRREAVELTERLRTLADWPVPRQRLVESARCLFVLQEMMAGEPVHVLSRHLAEELVALHGSRRGIGGGESGFPWARRLVVTLADGGSDYCRHDTLRRHDARTAGLVEEVEAFGAEADPADFLGNDIVHWDLHPGNILIEGDTVAAVVDCDFCGVGDADFDLVMLALTSTALPSERGVRRELFATAMEPLPDVRRRAYLGHLFIRLLDWPIRRGSAHEVEHWLSQVERCRAEGYF